MASLKQWAFAACVLLAFTSACSSASRSARSAGPERATQSVQAGELRLDELEPQSLERGSCGMFLWARVAEQPVFVFVALANPAEARVRINGRQQFLRRTAAEGQSRHGHFESQTYSGGGVTMEADVRFGVTNQVRDGVILDGGVLRMRDREGWETIVPVTGMVACQT